MKVVVVNFTESKGGAAKAAKRLHESLLSKGINSIYLTQFKTTNDEKILGNNSVIGSIIAKLDVKREELPLKKYNKISQTLFSASLTGSKSIVHKINNLKPDIVHLHWINAGMLGIKQLLKIKAPIVWSMHDMWAFTGGCHYTEDCQKYITQCGSCKVLNSNDSNDLSHKVFELKKHIYQLKEISFVGLSKWMANTALKSTLLENQIVVNIPNPINLSKYKVIDKIHAKQKLGLPTNKKIILFGAMGATSDPRKGYKYLERALNFINSDDVELAIFGSSENMKHPKFKTHSLGYINNDKALNFIYAAADVMLVPSIQENLSNAIMESLSSGTPVVGFNIGGNSDMIDHKKNGYLAVSYDSTDLAKGIDFVLGQKTDQLSKNARKKTETTFEQSLVAKQYINLYNKIINHG